MKESKSLAELLREKNWDMGQARTCLVCGDILLTKKDLRIHRAKHRNKMEMSCAETVTT